MSRAGRRNRRNVLVSMVAVAALTCGTPAGQALADASEPAPPVEMTEQAEPTLELAAVDEVPADLVTAVQNDLGMSWEDFVRAGAEVEAAQPALLEAGPSRIGVLTQDGVRLEEVGTLGEEAGAESSFADLDAVRDAYVAQVGTEGLSGVVISADGFEILVADPEDARDRGRADATAPLVSPAQWGRENGVAVRGTAGEMTPSATLRGGSPIAFNGVGCSHGFNGWYNGSTRGIAVGHCVTMGGTRVTNSAGYLGTVDWYQFGGPGSGLETRGTDLATYTISGYDTPPQIISGSSSLTITGRAAAVVGMPVCKQGRMTGWTCSTVTQIGWQWIGDGSGDITKPKRWVWSLFANTRIIPGDSGGPWVAGRKAVGVTSSYDWHDDGSPYSTAALLTSFDEYRPGAQVKIWLGRSTLPSAEFSDSLTARARWSDGQVVEGRLTRLSGDFVSPGTVVDIYVDGNHMASPQVASDGSFSFTYTGSDSASHKVTLRARSGDSRGSRVTVYDQPAGIVPDVHRYGGEDRYETAAKIVNAHWGEGSGGTVYITSGATFPDALSGGTKAGSQRAPVLLTKAGGLPAVTKTALARIRPTSIVIVGGQRAVNGSVASELRQYAPVSRISGENRYEVAANVAATYDSASTVYVASGDSYADALAISPRAGRQGMPLLLTKFGSLPQASAAQLQRLNPSRIVVLGGRMAVSNAVVDQLGKYSSNVVRVAGTDRYDGAAKIAGLYQLPMPLSRAWLVSGTDFPDALAAGPAAALHGNPILLAKSQSLSSAAEAALHRLDPKRIHVAGGTGAISVALVRELRWLTFR